MVVPGSASGKEEKELEDMYNKIQKAKETLVANERKTVRFVAHENEGKGYLRKIIEYAFKETEIEIIIEIRKNQKEAREGQK